MTIAPITFTPWLESTIRPAHPGVYEVRASFDSPKREFCYWNGEAWSFSTADFDLAVSFAKTFEQAPNQSRTWRGVTPYDMGADGEESGAFTV